jgi:Pyruvate/2-oxoacid:ferredoxin oxidoreductase delta subunit
MIREIVTIDETKCDGCGLCVPACHEGAIRIVDGKAQLVADRLCDGLGACLGHCPRDAITIERREADDFDEAAVAAANPAPCGDLPQVTPASGAAPHGGCPGSRLMQFAGRAAAADDAAVGAPASELTHWPVQLQLLPPQAPVLRGARLLIAADCVPVAYAGFHQQLLRGRAVLIGCPKFDDLPGYVQKLTEIIRLNGLREIVVARMEVPCCMGIAQAVHTARAQAGVDVPVREVVIGTDGEVRGERTTHLTTAACN